MILFSLPEAGEVHPDDGLGAGGGGLQPGGDLGALLQLEDVGVRPELAAGHQVVLGDGHGSLKSWKTSN